ncbi:hypothetical protein CCAX7_16690 [Capsulimonas corticalis]|uniref:Uncharacterized protein n=1 Tax=Capsulimonas corticalis TaxID=2219043 RepID=A0A402CYX2_9BACT|nr:hypothetical protein [Capsulimonas corticalis]BDI29618.1 hypothetical protein CCAX7_16690 [Capsulimonas corticalis]
MSLTMGKTLRAVSALGAAAAIAGTMGVSQPANAGWCNTNGCTLTLTGHITVRNNWWGVASTGASGWQDVWTNGSANWGSDFSWNAGNNQYGVKTFADTHDGWAWGGFNGSPFPQQINWGGSSWIKSTANNYWCNGTQDTIWDCFYSYSSNPGSSNPNTELEVWLTASINPSGWIYNTTVDGVFYNVYYQHGNWDILAYVPSYASSRTVNIYDISKDACNHGRMSTNEYLLNIDFGPEIYQGSGSMNCGQFYAP